MNKENVLKAMNLENGNSFLGADALYSHSLNEFLVCKKQKTELESKKQKYPVLNQLIELEEYTKNIKTAELRYEDFYDLNTYLENSKLLKTVDVKKEIDMLKYLLQELEKGKWDIYTAIWIIRQGRYLLEKIVNVFEK